MQYFNESPSYDIIDVTSSLLGNWNIMDVIDQNKEFFLKEELLDFPVKRRSYRSYFEDDNYVLEMEVPGYSKEDILVSIFNNVLTIKSKEKSKEDSKSNFRGFEYSLTLNSKLEVEKTQCFVKDGILKIIIPKLEKKKSLEIPIQ